MTLQEIIDSKEGFVNYMVQQVGNIDPTLRYLVNSYDGDSVKLQQVLTMNFFDIPLTNTNYEIYEEPVPPKAKIYDYAKEDAVDKHFHNIDYKTELTQSLYPKRTFVHGELQNVQWFADSGLTNKVLNVDMVYTRDAVGFATERTTERTWILDDETGAPDKKNTHKIYTINLMDQIVEGKKRRRNIVDGVQLPVMAFLMEVLYPASQGSIILTGREFMDRFEVEFNKFVENSSSVTDSQDLNFGKKQVVVAFEVAADTWLDGTPAALGGATIRQYLIGEFSI